MKAQLKYVEGQELILIDDVPTSPESIGLSPDDSDLVRDLYEAFAEINESPSMPGIIATSMVSDHILNTLKSLGYEVDL